MNKSFSEKVYDAVCKIPRGSVATYGQVAAAAGSGGAARAVGNALHKNPAFGRVPCHRVVNSQGRLADAFVFGGVNVQKELLEKEGVEVRNNHVDLKRFQVRVL